MEWKKLIIIDSVKLSTTGYKQPLRKEENSKSYEFAVVYFTTLCVQSAIRWLDANFELSQLFESVLGFIYPN